MSEPTPLPRVGVLLANLGSPDAPTPAAVRRYLREFLGDRRVVDAPRLPWWLLLNLVILPRRSPRSAELYRRIWTSEGSPLVVFTRRLAAALQPELERRLDAAPMVDWGMRYGQPGLAAAFGRLRDAGCNRILFLPLFPQRSGTTTGACLDSLERALAGTSPPPELRRVEDYHDHPSYIRALAASVCQLWSGGEPPGHLLISFHGLPQRYVDAGDDYPERCQATARLLAAELGLAPEAWSLTYQSRFGREAWLEPATDRTLLKLARSGREVDVICPGFAADCLETLEEIAITGRESYQANGGRRFRHVPALNDRPEHVAALADLVVERLAGWVERVPPAE